MPPLGFYNDLLYKAAAVAPGAFNDIQVGINNTTYIKSHKGSYYSNSTKGSITPTNMGYSAGLGYDLATGHGSPNGLLLARALTQIAHEELYSKTPVIATRIGIKTASSNVKQTLVVQPDWNSRARVRFGPTTRTVNPGSPLGLDVALAQKMLQKDFDPGLVELIDGFAQSTPFEVELKPSDSLTLRVNRSPLKLLQPTLTNDAGLITYGAVSQNVKVARPVAVAATPHGANDVDGIVRMRSIGSDNLSLSFFRVDDLTGTISGVAPGADNYASLAAGRLYTLGTGETSIANPSRGNFAQTTIKGINNGDLIAMRLTNNTMGFTFWSFANQNTGLNTSLNRLNSRGTGQNNVQLMNYGLNTWGWEERPIGRIADFNDLIVGLDFTSAAGNGWLL